MTPGAFFVTLFPHGLLPPVPCRQLNRRKCPFAFRVERPLIACLPVTPPESRGPVLIAIYAPLRLYGLFRVGQRYRFPSARMSSGRRSCCARISRKVSRRLLMVFLLPSRVFYERSDVFRPPDSGTGAELYRLGIAPGTAALPPGAFTDGDKGKHLRETKKASRGNIVAIVTTPYKEEDYGVYSIKEMTCAGQMFCNQGTYSYLQEHFGCTKMSCIFFGKQNQNFVTF